MGLVMSGRYSCAACFCGEKGVPGIFSPLKKKVQIMHQKRQNIELQNPHEDFADSSDDAETYYLSQNFHLSGSQTLLFQSS